MKIFAHRGYSGIYPENTMLAYRKAHKAGADAIELDCHLTRDGHIVLIHDELLERTTDASGPVAHRTLDELRKTNAASHHEGRHPAAPIPTFEEYCEWAAANGVDTNVEIKTDLVPYPDIERKIWDTIARHGLQDKVLLSSFNHVSLLLMREIAPRAKLGALVWEEAGARAYLADYCTRHGFAAWHPSAAMVTPELVAECHEAGVEVNAWTVDDFTTFRRLFAAGVDGIFTDYPEAAIRWRTRLESHGH